jgi:signal transduction histidine kinase
MSLRLRLSLLYSLLALLAVLAVGALSTTLLIGALKRQFLHRLSDQADAVAAGFNHPQAALGARALPSGALVSVVSLSGKTIVATPGLRVTGPLRSGPVTVDGAALWATTRRWVVGGAQLGQIWVALPRSSLDSAILLSWQVLVLGALIAAVLTGLAGWWAGRSLLRGLGDAAEAADRLGAEQAGPLPLPRYRDEVHRLVSAINRLIQGLKAEQAFEKRFLAQVAHELGAPLTALQGYLERAARGGSSRDLLMATKLASELQFAAQDLLQVGRGATEPNLIWHYLSAEQIRERLGRLVEGVQFAGDWKQPVLCDPDRLVQALRNVLANARRAAGPEGQVRACLESREAELVFRITDDGPGLPEDAEQLFAPFVSRSASAGLGLAVARQLIALHGGRIEARNLPVGGAEFCLFLPKPQSEEEEGEPAPD